jgi:hypothetical protein
VRIYDRARLVQNIIATQIVDGDEGAQLIDFGVSRDGESAEADEDQKYGPESNVGVRIFQAHRKFLAYLLFIFCGATMVWSGERASRRIDSWCFPIAIGIWISCAPLIFFGWKLIIT